jgi:hypothetical protein
MRESRSYGSVRGACSNARPYRDPYREFVMRLPLEGEVDDALAGGWGVMVPPSLCSVGVSLRRQYPPPGPVGRPPPQGGRQ